MKPLISLCMIVKNEEAMLPRCLDSVRDVVDEMVIVDTGSTDRTVEIAKTYTDKVYLHPWQDSFSEARNHGLQFATGDWILQMDADEELERADIPLIRQVVRNRDVNSVLVALLNETAKGWSRHYFQRLFRRGRARYEGIVHNQLICKGNPLRTEIRIYHYGYNLPEDQMRGKMERTESLLLKQLEKNPDDLFAHVNLLRVMRASKRFKEGIVQGRKTLDLCGESTDDAFRQMAALDTVICLQMAGRKDEAEALCRDVLKDFPANPDLTYMLGGLLAGRADYAGAIAVFEMFLKILDTIDSESPGPFMTIETLDFDHKVRSILAECYLQTDDPEKAASNGEAAVVLKPENADYRRILGRVYMEQIRSALRESREKLLTERVSAMISRIDQPDLLKMAAGFCFDARQYGTAIRLFEKALETDPGKGAVLAEIAACYAAKGEIRPAFTGYKEALALDPDNVRAIAGLRELQDRLSRERMVSSFREDSLISGKTEID